MDASWECEFAGGGATAGGAAAAGAARAGRRLLDDPVFFAPFVPFFDPRVRRRSTPMETTCG